MTLQVLVTDDQPHMRTTLGDILRDEGYDVDTAPDGATAVTMCDRKNYDAILMDVRMPGINGVEAFRRIRARQADARVILMSAYPVDELKRTALDEGAIAFLSKPLDVEKVVKLIQESSETAILIVNGDPGEIGALRDNLRNQGYHVTVAQTPQEALELVEQIGFDLVFIDAALPVMNGLELYLAIKRISPASIAIMTCSQEHPLAALAEEAVRNTAYATIPKPIDIEAVLQMLRRLRRQRVSGVIHKPQS